MKDVALLIDTLSPLKVNLLELEILISIQLTSGELQMLIHKDIDYKQWPDYDQYSLIISSKELMQIRRLGSPLVAHYYSPLCPNSRSSSKPYYQFWSKVNKNRDLDLKVVSFNCLPAPHLKPLLNICDCFTKQGLCQWSSTVFYNKSKFGLRYTKHRIKSMKELETFVSAAMELDSSPDDHIAQVLHSSTLIESTVTLEEVKQYGKENNLGNFNNKWQNRPKKPKKEWCDSIGYTVIVNLDDQYIHKSQKRHRNQPNRQQPLGQLHGTMWIQPSIWVRHNSYQQWDQLNQFYSSKKKLLLLFLDFHFLSFGLKKSRIYSHYNDRFLSQVKD